MNAQTITMSKKDALEAFRDYRKAVRERHNAEDVALMRGYKVLAKGRQVLDIHVAFQQAGVDARGRPRLAISRADLGRVEMCYYRDGSARFLRRRGYHWQKGETFYRVLLPPGTLPVNQASGEASAIVPIVPPRLRPAHALRGYHILWEAEWEDAPRDPMLLKHLGGALYAVLAVWDLTELERAVLRGRR